MNAATRKLIVALQLKAIDILTQITQKLMRPDLYDVCQANLGRDASPSDLAPDELGCAETVTTLLRLVYPQTPILVSTYALYDYLRNPANGFKAVAAPEPEAIVISPTGLGRAGTHGHTGICADNGVIMSNDSATGTFQRNYTVETWQKHFHGVLGYPVLFFKKV